MVQRTFTTPSALEISIGLPAGRIEVEATDTAETTVEVEPLDDEAARRLDEVRVELAGTALTVEAPERRTWFFWGDGFAVRVRCPARSALRVHTASAGVTARGVLGAFSVKAASGDVRVGAVDGPARVQTASGDVHIESIARRAEIRTASGDVSIGDAGESLAATLVSGDLSVRSVAGAVDANTVSGDQWFGSVGGSITTKSVSGDVKIGVRRGATIWLDVRSVSGDTTSELDVGVGDPEPGTDVVEVRARSVSGDIRVARAEATVAER